ncbi:MAG: type II toxin-antitoxin system VapC family toxin [Thermoleophilia bacterium]|nr:type II toxin-antitoxin system VapC family toxin [Thermoleophilia bacterium]
MTGELDLLLDTHAVIWLVGGDDRVRNLLPVLDDDGSTVSVSAVSWIEIAIKNAVGKLELSVDAARQVTRMHGILDLPLTADHAQALELLPLHHSDPFDRMLAAQALAESMTIATVDDAFDAYDGVATLWP